jgi:hypothetical protein
MSASILENQTSVALGYNLELSSEMLSVQEHSVLSRLTIFAGLLFLIALCLRILLMIADSG